MYWPPLINASTTEIHSNPFHNHLASSAVDGAIANPTASCWVSVFHLAILLRRHADSFRPDEGAVQADCQLACGDDGDRQDRERVVADQEEHRPEDQHLVGQGVEEGADRRGPVTACEVPVDSIGAAQHEPQRERLP